MKNLPHVLEPLMDQRRWVNWKNKGGKKLPFQAKTNKVASTADPTTWSSYRDAVEAAPENGGVGFVLADSGVAALDLDDCRDPDTGALDDWAQRLVDKANGAYVEVTPSKRGVRIIGMSEGGPVHTTRQMGNGKVEAYRDTARYITVSGDQLGECNKLGNIDALIDETVAAKPIANKDTSRSGLFHSEVCKLGEKGWSAERIEVHMRQHASQYKHTKASQYDSEGRLGQEVERSLKNAGINARKAAAQPKASLLWDGDPPPPTPPERIKGLVPEVGIGIEHGQFSTGKTYIALDLCLSGATGSLFIGRNVIKPCGSLFLAYERPYSVFPRWNMARRMKHPGLLKRLPFAMLGKLPPLMDDDALDTLVSTAKDANKKMQGDFGVPLGLIIIDTLVVATGGLSDGTAQEVQPIMNRMRELSNETQTFVLGLDHQGHTPGRSRGSSDKYGTPDLSWSIEAEDKKAGTLTVQKYADGVQGDRFHYTLVLEETKYEDGEREPSVGSDGRMRRPWLMSRRR